MSWASWPGWADRPRPSGCAPRAAALPHPESLPRTCMCCMHILCMLACTWWYLLAPGTAAGSEVRDAGRPPIGPHGRPCRPGGCTTAHLCQHGFALEIAHTAEWATAKALLGKRGGLCWRSCTAAVTCTAGQRVPALPPRGTLHHDRRTMFLTAYACSCVRCPRDAQGARSCPPVPPRTLYPRQGPHYRQPHLARRWAASTCTHK